MPAPLVNPETAATRDATGLMRPLALPALSLLVSLIVLAGLEAATLSGHNEALISWLRMAGIASAVVSALLLLHRLRRSLIQPIGRLFNLITGLRHNVQPGQAQAPPAAEPVELAIADLDHVGAELRALSSDMDSRVRSQTQRLSRKTRTMEILYEVSVSINTARSLDELLDTFLDTLLALFDAPAASVRLLTGNGYTEMVAARGLSQETIDRDYLTDVGRCHCGWAATEGGVRFLHGTQHCSRLLGAAYMEPDCLEFIIVPIQYQDRILGVYNLCLNKPSSEIGDDVRDLLTSVGRHLGLAIEKSRMDDDARRLAIIEERNMIGNELHDSLAQSLVSMRLNTKMLGELLYKQDIHGAENALRRLQIALNEGNASLRELLSNFRSRMDERGLVPAIGEMVARFEEETGITALFHNECTKLSLTPAQEIQVFRIIQEALANIRRHSDAHTARIMLSDENDGYQLLIEDDGQGMAESESAGTHRGEHIGLSIMRERAARLPGSLAIESEPGEGTRISLRFHSGNSPTTRRSRP